MKTGVPLFVRLGDLARKALAAPPAESERISSGTAPRSVEGRPHRFRIRSQCGCWRLGTIFARFNLLLGHTSIKTTEKHYAPSGKSFQAHQD